MDDIVGQADRVSEMKLFLSLSLFLLLFPPLLLLFLLFSFSSLLSFFIAPRLKHQKNPNGCSHMQTEVAPICKRM